MVICYSSNRKLTHCPKPHEARPLSIREGVCGVTGLYPLRASAHSPSRPPVNTQDPEFISQMSQAHFFTCIDWFPGSSFARVGHTAAVGTLSPKGDLMVAIKSGVGTELGYAGGRLTHACDAAHAMGWSCG